MLNSDENREKVFAVFPELRNDISFIIRGKENPNFNCIAHAALKDDIWWEPLPLNRRPLHLDGVTKDWPFGVAFSTNISTYSQIFQKLGYSPCNAGDFEENYRKIALYGKNAEKIEHAARQLTTEPNVGIWTSKLGKSFEIYHGNPRSIEGPFYGQILQFMKKEMK